MKKITIVGVGALGSYAALFLRNEASIKLVDMDRIEQRNLLSQFHGKVNVGKNKAQALQQTLQFLFGIKVESIPHKLTKENDKQLLAEADLILDCLDNAEARKIVQDFARAKGLPCVHGALAADGSFGRVAWDEGFVIDSEAVKGAATCEGGEFLPFIGVVAALMSRSVQEFLHNGKKIGFEVHPNGVIRT
jgi:predicted ThiF/HesA family dinucleotide-utilizing enzyme